MRRILSFSIALLCLQIARAGLSVPHITPENGDFETLIYFVNTSERPRSFSITPYDATGNSGTDIQLTLAGNEVRAITPRDLFGVGEVAHFDFEDNGVIRALLRYRARNGGSLNAHVLPERNPSFSFRLQTGGRAWIWDAFALVNKGASAATVTIAQFDESGSLLAEKTWTGIDKNRKLLVVLSDDFAHRPGARYDIASDQPANLIALRGTNDPSRGEIMYQAQPTPDAGGAARLWIPHVASSGSDFSSLIVLENLSESAQSLTLQPYTGTGVPLAPITVEVAAGETRELEPLTIDASISHFSYVPTSPLRVRFGYRRADGAGMTALLQTSPGARGYTAPAGAQTVSWDGFAIVNTGESSVDVTVAYYGPSGSLIGEEVIGNLASHAKALVVPEQIFDLVPDGYYRITADGKLGVVSLRGSRDSTVLFGNPALPDQFIDLGNRNVVNLWENPEAILAITPDTVSLTKEVTPPDTGSVMVGSETTPFLRRVDSVVDRGNFYELATTRVSLEEVVKEGSLYAAFDITEDSLPTRKTSSRVQFTSGASLTVNADVTVSPSLRPIIEWDTSDDESDRVRLSAVGSLDIGIAAEINGTTQGSLHWDKTVLDTNLGTDVYFIGWLPVVVSWDLMIEARAELNGNAEGNLRWSSGADFRVEAGIERIFDEDGGWERNHETTLALRPVEKFFNVTADLTARFVITPRLEAKVYDVAGPFLSFGGYTRGNLDLTDRRYELGVGLAADLGFVLDAPILGLDQDVNLRVLDRYWKVEEGDLEGTGVLSGLVKDAFDGSPLEGVLVEIRRSDSGELSGFTTTGASGQFEMVLSAGEQYDATLSKTDYREATYRNIAIETGETVFLETVLQIAEVYAGAGNISGSITNALDGTGVSGLTIQFRGGINTFEGSVVASTTTGSRGFYQQNDLEAGHYTAEASGDGYSTVFFTVVCLGGRVIGNQDATIIPLLSEGETRIVLTWGVTPYDLDSHLTGPSAFGDRFHVYFGNKFYSDNLTRANLDRDDLVSFGPETITIERQTDGVYRYYVHDYSNGGSGTSTGLSNSGARVEVYRGGTRVGNFIVPPNRVGTLWHVFNLSGDVITPVNTMTTNYDITKTAHELDLGNLPVKSR
ncbi:MAG: carboxypeptidase regulatory-like domain-containing protein [Acidobacteriota bacterium]|nr:carboxypeptidase regulatory-like domain-containing protein [Acidobacteriota bacterium]